MPITIKELFPSDPISEALEKINFNFDQLILAGGGPPGPPGPLGPQGVPGPLGIRGDHWFVGPSAFGQTADHDGGLLLIEDHYLDPLGDVYSYFDNGSTGWTATSVNLMGPQGPTGVTGGSLDLEHADGGAGNAVTPQVNGWGPQQTSAGTTGVDFMIPINMGKNAFFIGDRTWAVDYLKYFGSNAAGGIDQKSVPQLTIIQKNTNTSGLNGLMFGAYGATTGATSSALAEGGTGATTSVFDFVHFGYAKPLAGSSYDRLFRIKTFTQKFRIEIGGPVSVGSFDQLTPLQLASNTFSWVNNAQGQFLSTLTRQSIITYDTQAPFGIDVSGIEITSKPNLISGQYVGAKWSIVGLQTQEGPASASAFNTAHGLGNVHIGMTSTANYLIGSRTQQGLGIARPIYAGYGNNDASIRFFDKSSLVDNDLNGTNEWATIQGGIRSFTNQITNISGTFWIRSMQIGAGVPVMGAVVPSNNSRQLGGRIGINNHPGWNDYNAARTVNFPIHFNLGGYNGNDKATTPYPGQSTFPNIEQWALGIDYDRITGSESGVYHAGIDIESAGFGIGYGVGHTAISNSGTFYSTRPIVLNSYYAGSLSAGYSFLPLKKNPNMFMQLGRNSSSDNSGDPYFGNLGLGFSPSGNQIGTDAYSKLSINGGITIGDVTFGYHARYAYRPDFGVLIQGTIAQGASGATSLFATNIYSQTAVKTASDNNIGIIVKGLSMGDKFVSKNNITGTEFDKMPNFSMPDLRTGLLSIPGVTGRGYFTIPAADALTGYNQTVGPTSTLRTAGFWSMNSDEGVNGHLFAPAMVASNRAVHAPVYGAGGEGGRSYTLQDLVNNGYGSNYTGLAVSGITLYRKYFWLVVPSTHSTAVLDFSTGATYGYWNNNSGGWTPNSDNLPYYLNGQSVGGTGSTRAIIPGSVGLTIEPGNYDGQKLTIIIKDVAYENSYMSPTIPTANRDQWYIRFKTERALNHFPSSAPYPSIPVATTLDYRDVLVMARDYYSTSDIKSPAFSNQGGMPFPTPNGVDTTSLLAGWNTVGSGFGATASIFSNIYDYQAGKVGWHSDRNSLIAKTGGTLLITGGWRIINFVWLNDYNAGVTTGANIGCWIETGREYLAPRGNISNSGSTVYTPPPADDPIDPPGGTFCCFVPGTLITMADGSNKTIETVNIGDFVLSYNIESKETVSNEVVSVYSPTRNSIYECSFDNGDSVKMTPDHPVYVIDKGWSSIDIESSKEIYELSNIEQLEVGDIVLGINENSLIIDIKRIEGLNTKTHTFTVDNKNAENYFANGILAHNMPANTQLICVV